MQGAAVAPHEAGLAPATNHPNRRTLSYVESSIHAGDYRFKTGLSGWNSPGDHTKRAWFPSYSLEFVRRGCSVDVVIVDHYYMEML